MMNKPTSKTGSKIERKMMTSRKGYCFLLSAIICILTATTFAGRCPSADLNGNCWVDIYDLLVFADQWLNPESCEETGLCADFDGLNGTMNFRMIKAQAVISSTVGPFLLRANKKSLISSRGAWPVMISSMAMVIWSWLRFSPC